MVNARKLASLGAVLALSMTYQSAAKAAAVLEAEYLFNNSLASDVAGAPNLTVVDPQNASGFVTDTVFGVSQTVYNFQSSSNAPDQQAGLVYTNTAGLIPSNNYSVQMTFKLTQRNGQWRRLVDSQNRQFDDGFYIDPNNLLNVFPTMTSGAAYTNGTYVNVALTVASDNTVNGYLNGTLEFTTNTTAMDITSDNVLDFFLDNTAGGGLGEWSPGDIAALRIYSGVLPPAQIDALNNATNPAGAPEPAGLAVLATGLIGMTLYRRWPAVPAQRLVSPSLSLRTFSSRRRA
jgi:Concanavalin A-like lectin/glucanases superfamily